MEGRDTFDPSFLLCKAAALPLPRYYFRFGHWHIILRAAQMCAMQGIPGGSQICSQCLWYLIDKPTTGGRGRAFI